VHINVFSHVELTHDIPLPNHHDDGDISAELAANAHHPAATSSVHTGAAPLVDDMPTAGVSTPSRAGAAKK
jgi:hypothetical protein